MSLIDCWIIMVPLLTVGYARSDELRTHGTAGATGERVSMELSRLWLPERNYFRLLSDIKQKVTRNMRLQIQHGPVNGKGVAVACHLAMNPLRRYWVRQQ